MHLVTAGQSRQVCPTWGCQWHKKRLSQATRLATKLFFPDLNLSKSRKLLFGGNSRKGYSIILQMITNFNHLAYHETNIGHMHDWTCRYCRDPDSKESTYHLISQCDAFAYVRFKTLRHPYPPPLCLLVRRATAELP